MEISIRNSSKLDDIQPMFHRIQSLLPIKDSARTGILSKSWLQAWSTMPNLRFSQSEMLSIQQEESKYVHLISRTMQRYIRDNIAIESFDLEISINNQESASLVEKWILDVSSKPCFKKLSLSILNKIDSFALPAEVFSADNLETVRITDSFGYINPVPMSGISVIKCMSLRELDFVGVNISEELLNAVLSTCKLLEKINVSFHSVLKTIKVKNLCFLRELKVSSNKNVIQLEIDDVPNLRVFYYHTVDLWSNPLPFNTDSLEKVTDLWFSGVIMYDSFFDMIKSKFPYLECLGIQTGNSGQENSLGRFDITCVHLKDLTLYLSETEQVQVQVHSPNLLDFCYLSEKVPILSFPTADPKQIDLTLLPDPVDSSFFIDLRKALTLSSKFDIKVRSITPNVPVQVGYQFDVPKRVSFPSTNVRLLSLELYSEKYFSQHLMIFDAFLSICNPTYIVAYRDRPFNDNKLYKKMVSWMVEKKMPDLIDVEIKNPQNGNPEALTSSWSSYPSGDWYSIKFKLNWRSQ